MTVRILVTKEEIEMIRSQDFEGGGFQQLFKSLAEGIHGNELVVPEGIARKSIQYSAGYGTGGWQTALQELASKFEAALSARDQPS